ncbi:MAG: type II/IV secretion system protein [Ramlibacter sp.]|nr:type II/IV secretion system protein [Ramlibacter sp.]
MRILDPLASSRDMTSSPPFDVLLEEARKSIVPGANLWQALTRESGLDHGQLSALLLQSQGVSVVSDLELIAAMGTRPPNDLGATGTCYELTVAKNPLLIVEDPWSSAALKMLARHSNGNARLALALPGQMELLRQAVSGGQDKLMPGKQLHQSTRVGPDGTVVTFVDSAIAHAYSEGASDVHFETHRTGIVIKYRLDGVMAPGASLPGSRQAEEVVSRIKVLAQLDITERRRPQDGRTRWRHPSGDEIDLRVSVMPSIFGEDVVLRLLDKARLRNASESISLDLLGFSEELGARIRALSSRPHGMLLVTGPTGSGKTTTVYAALSEVNTGLEKIITIEDPVEYELPGVLQIPVNEQKGLTFATGLRSILRHDPDKILVGEIRDAETAEIAVQSSLTGHLVFTTVHANSLLDVIGRFQHFDIDPFGLASALNGIIVQRLLRRVCGHCGDWRPSSEAVKALYASRQLAAPDRLPAPKGCSRCRDTGYRGRIVVAEVHQLSDLIRDLMVRKATMTELKQGIYRDGHDDLLSRALTMVAQGITSMEEVARVVGVE